MEYIKKNWHIILIAILVIFSLNRCIVACNRDNKISQQQIEIVHQDSVNKNQLDSIKMLTVRWDENQKGQENYQNLATGTKQELTNTIDELNNKIKTITNENNQLKQENKQLKNKLNGK